MQWAGRCGVLRMVTCTWAPASAAGVDCSCILVWRRLGMQQQLTCSASAGTGSPPSQAAHSSATATSARCMLKPAEGWASLLVNTSPARKPQNAALLSVSLHATPALNIFCVHTTCMPPSARDLRQDEPTQQSCQAYRFAPHPCDTEVCAGALESPASQTSGSS